MNKTIWKYILNPEMLTINIPRGATILTAREQKEEICIWVEVDPNNMLETRTFEVYGTGHHISSGIGVERKYIGSVSLHHGDLIFHVYEKIN